MPKTIGRKFQNSDSHSSEVYCLSQQPANFLQGVTLLSKFLSVLVQQSSSTNQAGLTSENFPGQTAPLENSILLSFMDSLVFGNDAIQMKYFVMLLKNNGKSAY